MSGSGFDDVGAAGKPDGSGVTKVKKREAKPEEKPPVEKPKVPPATDTTAKASADLQAGMVVSRVIELEAEEAKVKATRGALSTQYKFQMVQRGREKTELRPDLARIVETVWVSDMEKVWAKLRKNLRVGARRSEHAHLARCLDDARQIAFEAHQLMATAKREKSRWESENDVSHGAMWIKATMVCQAEKDTGLRSKMITDADIKAMAAALYPDEWVAQETRKKEIELTVDLITTLAKLATDRAQDLQTLLAKLRG
jgi:hypothetical protein